MVAANLLEQLDIPIPCAVAWASMRGNDRSRFCSQCRKHVHNISGMTRDEAVSLIQGAVGEVCVRFYRRPDGTVMTKDCGYPISLRQRMGRWLAIPMLLFVSCVGWAFAQDNPAPSNTRQLFGQAKPAKFDRYDNWMRRTQPFASILEWLDPAPVIIMGCPPIQQNPPSPPDRPIS